MTDVLQGNDITIVAQFYEYVNGPLTDLTGVTVTISRASDATVVLGPTSTGVVHVGTGIYSYTYSVPSNLTVGAYLCTISGTDSQSQVASASQTFNVLANVDGTWATLTDVDDITGYTVTTAQLQQAQSIVELFADTTVEASDAGMISSKNLRLLKWAVAYEAAFVKDHPDVFTNVDVDSYAQDGVSVVHAHANAALLAPLAKRCIDRLSWKRNGTINVAPRKTRNTSVNPNWDSETSDKYLEWSPL